MSGEIVLIYSSATVFGITCGVASGIGVYLRLVQRLNRRRFEAETARDLEKRRERQLSGRTDEPRAHAGPNAHVSSLLPITKLGSVAKRRQEKR